MLQQWLKSLIFDSTGLKKTKTKPCHNSNTADQTTQVFRMRFCFFRKPIINQDNVITMNKNKHQL